MSSQPHYGHVWLRFFRNSLVREMTFRANFIITIVTRMFWFAAQLTLFEIIYRNVKVINEWQREEYFAFMATGMLINAIVEVFFMPNCANFSELIRTGNLDFVLLKPIDTQFLVSFEKMNLAMLNQILLAGALLTYSLVKIGKPVNPISVVFFLIYIGIGVAFFYSLMIALASTSIWLGRNQGLYDFWFYITVFARYPRSIYGDNNVNSISTGDALQFGFTYMIPILLVVTVPARVLLEKPFENWMLPVIGVLSSIFGLVISRLIFVWSLRSYRSASS